jgi:antirestriction protein ArdC
MSGERLDWQRLLDEALTVEGSILGVYDRFHDYSLANVMLLRTQDIHEPVASYSRWKSLGRHVLRGARAKDVIVPVLASETPPAETFDEKRERVARLIGFKVVRAVFALSDTDGPEIPSQPTPGWAYQQALAKLGVREVPFDDTNGNKQGYSRGTEIAINPVAVRPTKTRFHELGHVILGHTLPHSYEDYQTHRGIREFQAEAVAYLCMNELGIMDDETATVSRGYIQHWLEDEHPPQKAIQQVFSAADRILRAGRTAEVAPVSAH